MGLPLIALVTLFGGTPEPAANQPLPTDPARYYLLLFGGQGDRLRPRTAHTWATYVRATPQGDGTTQIEAITISWLPATLHVRPFHLRPEEGKNLTLQETMDVMATGRHEIFVWGPFETSAATFAEAARQKEVLESGAVQFRTLNRRADQLDVSHCVRAVVRTNPELDAATNPIIWYGTVMTQRVANKMAQVGVVPEPNVTHDWLIPTLGIDHYHIDREPVGQLAPRHFLPRRRSN